MKERHVAIAEPDIVEHRQRGRKAQLLGHQSDTERLRVLRVDNCGRFPIDENHAAVRRMHAGDDLDQRALARAVLAADRADFRSLQRQGDIPENFVDAEPLGDPFNGKDAFCHFGTASAASGTPSHLP